MDGRIVKKKGRVIRDEGRGEGNTEHTKERRGGGQEGRAVVSKIVGQNMKRNTR